MITDCVAEQTLAWISDTLDRSEASHQCLPGFLGHLERRLRGRLAGSCQVSSAIKVRCNVHMRIDPTGQNRVAAQIDHRPGPQPRQSGYLAVLDLDADIVQRLPRAIESTIGDEYRRFSVTLRHHRHGNGADQESW